eukprot:192957_1
MSRYIRKEDFNGQILGTLIHDLLHNAHDIDGWNMKSVDNAIDAIKEKLVTCEKEKDTFTNLGILLLFRITRILAEQRLSEFDRANKYLKELYEMMVVKKICFAFQINFVFGFVQMFCEAALINIDIRPNTFKKVLALKLFVGAKSGGFYKNFDWYFFRLLIRKKMNRKLVNISIQHLNKCFKILMNDVNNADVVKCMKKIFEYQAYLLEYQGYNRKQCQSKFIKMIKNVKDDRVKERLIVHLQNPLKKKKSMYDQEHEAFEDICIILKSKENRLCIKNTMMGKKCSWCFSKCSKLSTCGKCQKEWYCCRNCQKRQWNRYHRYQCC